MESNITPMLNKKDDTVKEKRPNAFVRALKRIFVYNAGYKALAIILSCVIWLITVGLGG